ncbi:MAG: methyltransferase [Lachnospiraceae bacterium]|nr:methyltransferase [Lachnospiraceae bacterium]
MKQYLENIKNGREVRESLASLCGLLRSSGEKLSASDSEALVVIASEQLSSEDPKVRKNAARLLGMIGDDSEETVRSLVNAYKNEQTMYVRSTYLEALNGCDIANYRSALEERLAELQNTEVTADNRKHIGEETAALRKLLNSDVKAAMHKFVGYDADNTVMFIVNSCYAEMFANSIDVVRKKIVHGGVVVRTTKLREILKNRIWREAVFRIPSALSVPADPYEAASIIAGDTVREYLSLRLAGDGAIRYRIDLRSRDESVGSRFVKRLVQETDRLAGGRLCNSPGDYEVTFRLSEGEGNTYRFGVAFSAMEDTRFDYRRETVAGSIHPTDAAAVMAAAKQYLVDEAQMLDPFCGAGTMIAERMKAGRIRSAFGVDTYGPAIEKARSNVRKDNVWFVHRDFFDYRQDHLFDEIVTNMPFREDGADDEIVRLYRRFFRKIREHLREDGTLVMVSHDPRLAVSSVPSDMQIVKRIRMRERGDIEAFVIRFLELA